MPSAPSAIAAGDVPPDAADLLAGPTAERCSPSRGGLPTARRLAVLCCLLLSVWAAGCERATPPAPTTTILKDILQSGTLRVITRNNANCYYWYREQAMGFEYELAKAFAEHLGVDLQIQIAEKWEGMIPSLMARQGDLIAASMTITPRRQQQVVFSDGYMNIEQRIIVHRSNSKVRSVADLAGRDVYVRKGTSYEERLEELRKAGIKLFVYLASDTPTEDLIRQVAERRIPITIADSNIAELNRRYFPQVTIAEPISRPEKLGWAVHPDARDLLARINAFFKEIKESGLFQEIYDRYYTDSDNFNYVDLRSYHRRLKTRLPAYREIIKQEADKHNFDWRLIAAQIYQESHFNPKARSHSGAYGLMQLTRSTARSLDVKNIFDPAENIRAGVAHLKNLFDYFDQSDGPDRLFIALAAYNIGQGHILDARNLARRRNLNPDKWAALVETLPLLSKPEHYKEALYGFCRGTEPINYIKQIMVYYDILKRQAIEYVP